MVSHFTSFIRHHYYKNTNFLFIYCGLITVVHVHGNILSQMNHGQDANRINPECNLKVADKHAAEHAKTACLDTNKSVCNA